MDPFSEVLKKQRDSGDSTDPTRVLVEILFVSRDSYIFEKIKNQPKNTTPRPAPSFKVIAAGSKVTKRLARNWVAIKLIFDPVEPVQAASYVEGTSYIEVFEVMDCIGSC